MGKATATIEEVFGESAAFAHRIIRLSPMKEVGRQSKYVNLSFGSRANVAQLHAHSDGIGLVLCSDRAGRPQVDFRQIPVDSLSGYTLSNVPWLNGAGDRYRKKGPAVAFLIPDEIAQIADDSLEWRNVVELLEHAKDL